MNHPNLSDEINRNIAQSEIDGGVWLYDCGMGSKEKNILPVGGVLEVKTRNTLYRIEKRGQMEFYISGHLKYCPQPTRANIHGSNWGGSMLKVGFVGRGMHLEFSTNAHPSIVTTAIQEITEVNAPVVPVETHTLEEV